MGCLLILILLVLLLGYGTWITIGLTLGLVGLVLFLLMAGLVGWAADAVVPGTHPGGWPGAVLTGIVGGFAGNLLFSVLRLGLGPQLFGIHVVPAFVGAVVILLVLRLFTSRRAVATY
jgi:uncharacterized membrane protein YeaQ/YmgE (transglycosylase-associated protein family)